MWSMPIVVPNGKVGIVFKKFGDKLDPGQVLADPDARSARAAAARASAGALQRIFESVRL